MSAINFVPALDFVLRPNNDGQGYHNDPKDPGGATTWGWTFSTWANWCRLQGLPVATLAAFKDLTRTSLTVPYRVAFWNVIQGDQLPNGVDVSLFDVAVMSSPFFAAKFLQEVLDVKQDGHVGPVTLLAAKGADPARTIRALCQTRDSYYKSLPTFRIYGNGWERRANDCMSCSLGIAGLSAAPPAPPTVAPTPAPVTADSLMAEELQTIQGT